MSAIMIEYHPVKNEIYFSHENNGKFFRYSSKDLKRLSKYINTNGEFLLQNQGVDFFDCLVSDFINIKNQPLVFKGTLADYRDFCKMVNSYNRYKGEEILKVDRLIELHNVNEMYDSIVAFSQEVMDTFEKKIEIDFIREAFEKHKIQYLKKKEKLDENCVNLCFVGTYSSGKSTLINAIIGEKILPDSIKSETAKMFKIQNSSDAYVIVHLQAGDVTKNLSIKWNEEEGIFYCDTKLDDGITGKLTTKLNSLSGYTKAEQMEIMLKTLNDFPSEKGKEDEPYITGMIEVFYPIPFGQNVNFTFYDTPGTDSNCDEHLRVLRQALKEQTNSILIVLYHPQKMEGTGNSILFELMQETQDCNSNEDNVTIDMSRSIHIINAIDSIKGIKKNIPLLINGKIKTSTKHLDMEKDDITEYEYDLSDKRVFVTSAIAGYLAKKRQLHDLTEDEEYDYEDMIDATIRGRYYKYNHLGQADNETAESIEAANNAMENTDENYQMYVGSGLYSVEQEILNYANKFALCVKTKSLYQSISYLIDEVSKQYQCLSDEKDQQIDALKRKIERLRAEMLRTIQQCTREFRENALTPEALSDDRYVKNINTTIDNYRERAKKIAKKMSTFARETSKFEHKNQEILKKLNEYMGDIHQYYIKEREKIIRSLTETLKNAIREKLHDCDDIPKTWIDGILDTQTQIEPSNIYRKSMDTYVAEEKLFGFWFKIDKAGYREEIEKDFDSKTKTLYDKYIEELLVDLAKSSKDLEEQISRNIEKLSSGLHNLCDNRDELIAALERLSKVLEVVSANRNNLDMRIWESGKSEG